MQRVQAFHALTSSYWARGFSYHQHTGDVYRELRTSVTHAGKEGLRWKLKIK